MLYVYAHVCVCLRACVNSYMMFAFFFSSVELHPALFKNKFLKKEDVQSVINKTSSAIRASHDHPSHPPARASDM